MRSEYTHHDIVWIDLQSPTRSEVRTLMETHGIPPIIAEELLLPSAKDRIEFYPGFFYAIMHFPALKQSHTTKEQEIDFIVGRDFIITTRYEGIDPLHQFLKLLEVNTVLDKSVMGEHAGYLFFYMLKRLYKSVEHEVDILKHTLADIEKHIFSGEEREMVQGISTAARDLLNLRQTIEPHREVLRALTESGSSFFGEAFIPYVKGLENEYYRVHNHTTRQMDALRELRETNNSLLSTKQNEIMKTLTIITVFTAPLALAAAIFGMSTPMIPLINAGGPYWIIVGCMALASIVMYFYFRKKRWL